MMKQQSEHPPNAARVWDELANRYDTVVRLFGTSYPAVRERLHRDLENRPRVLEVAAGTGQFTSDLAASAESLLATDISPNMVAHLRDAVEEDNVRITVMSAYELDVDDHSLDAIFCANALHVMEEPERALLEFRRTLRPGGILITPTFLHGVDPLRRGLSRALSVVSPFVASSRLDLEGLERLIARAGFEVLHSEQLPGLFPLGYVVSTPIALPN